LTQQPFTVERELRIEQAHVDLVYSRLSEATRSAQQVATAGRSLYQSDRSSFVREEDGTGLYERDVFAFQAARRLAELDAEHEGLVFGRLDLTGGEIRYVGRIGVRDADYEPLVIDWRAPAAEPFYRATPTQPMQVIRRRVLRCRAERVVGIEDDLIDGSADTDLVVVGEGALLAALTRARGRTMRDIVATIQAEQDKAIRAPHQGFTMISGGPGTGKTVVALHRAAYLLYSNRRRFESGGVLVVGPSRTFMNYIERVLPSLGEDSVILRSIGSVASDVVKITGDRLDPPAVAAIKGSLRMVPVLRHLVTEPLPAGPLELRLTWHGHVLVLTAGTLAQVRTDVLSRHRYNHGRDAAERALLNALWRIRPPEVEAERDDFEEQLASTEAFQVFVNAWWPLIGAPESLARLADPALLVRLSASVLSNAECALISASYQASNGDAPDWTAADGALLDELANMLGPVPEPDEREVSIFLDPDSEVSELITTMERLAPVREADPFATTHETYAHILVDEAQDVSPMQWRMLRRRGGSASWTIVSDPAQSSWPDAAEANRALTDIIGAAPVRRFRLGTNYRSPAEVFDLAARVVVAEFPGADLPVAVRTTGVEPELRTAASDRLSDAAVEAVDALLRQVEGTVGVITPPSRKAAIARRLRQLELSGWDRLSVTTSVEAKGLEYDGVLVITPDEIVAESPGGIRSLYVALTRPTQRLITLDEVISDGHAVADWRRSLE
jgi:DNA polymerase III delta prime subunit